MKKTEFNKLKALWYKKLEESGFTDIEQDEIYLKRGVSVIDPRRITWQSQAEYYHMATNFLNDHRFRSNLEKVMWEYRSEGMSIRDIAITLSKALTKPIPRMSAWRIINRLEQLMKKRYGVIK